MSPEYQGRSQHVIFEGRLGSGKAFQKEVVEVLAGEAAPTPSAGYSKWARVPRPQRVALTIHEGYEPFTLTVPILFDAVKADGQQENVELKIQRLEWMAGRGIIYNRNHPAGVGPPPLVRVFSQRSPEISSELVPKPFQVEKIPGEPTDLWWGMEDITFDEHPLRSPGGARIRQAAVVKLVELVRDQPPPPGPPGPSYTVFRTTPSLNTVKKLVKAHMAPFLLGKGKLSEAIKKTIELNRSNKAIGTNPEKKLKAHTPVKIPNEFL